LANGIWYFAVIFDGCCYGKKPDAILIERF